MPRVEFSDWTDFGHTPISWHKCHPNHMDRMEEEWPLGAKGFRRKRNGCRVGRNDSLRLKVLGQWGGYEDFNSGTEQLRLDWGFGSGEGGADGGRDTCRNMPVPLRGPGGLGQKAWRAAGDAEVGCPNLLQGLFKGSRPRHPLAMGLQIPARA